MSHVALIIPTIDRIGGAERHMLTLAAGLRRRGWKVTVVALAGTGGETAEGLRREGIGYLSLEMRKGLADPRGWLRLRRWLRQQKPEVVHAHLPHAAWMVRCSRAFAPSAVVVDTIHSASTGGWGRRAGYRLSRSLSDRVIAVSRAAAEAHVSAGMVNPAQLTVIANGIDDEEWRADPTGRAALRRELSLGEEFVWLAAGRLEPVKDYPAMLRAFARVSGSARPGDCWSGTATGRARGDGRADRDCREGLLSGLCAGCEALDADGGRISAHVALGRAADGGAGGGGV